jgi:hypothetical protein
VLLLIVGLCIAQAAGTAGSIMFFLGLVLAVGAFGQAK